MLLEKVFITLQMLVPRTNYPLYTIFHLIPTAKNVFLAHQETQVFSSHGNVCYCNIA